MKTTKLMAAALCAAACVTTTAYAEDDFGIESASPVKIADPVNPQPGMVFNAYGRYSARMYYMGENELKESTSKLITRAAIKTQVDKGENFSIKQVGQMEAYMGRWEGFLKCKRSDTYTFVVSKGGGGWDDGFSLRINGVTVIPAATTQASCDVNLNVGWNKVEIVCQYYRADPLIMSFKPKNSLAEPRQIGPKDLFHDQKPEEDW